MFVAVDEHCRIPYCVKDRYNLSCLHIFPLEDTLLFVVCNVIQNTGVCSITSPELD